MTELQFRSTLQLQKRRCRYILFIKLRCCSWKSCHERGKAVQKKHCSVKTIACIDFVHCSVKVLLPLHRWRRNGIWCLSRWTGHLPEKSIMRWLQSVQLLPFSDKSMVDNDEHWLHFLLMDSGGPPVQNCSLNHSFASACKKNELRLYTHGWHYMTVLNDGHLFLLKLARLKHYVCTVIQCLKSMICSIRFL